MIFAAIVAVLLYADATDASRLVAYLAKIPPPPKTYEDAAKRCTADKDSVADPLAIDLQKFANAQAADGEGGLGSGGIARQDMAMMTEAQQAITTGHAQALDTLRELQDKLGTKMREISAKEGRDVAACPSIGAGKGDGGCHERVHKEGIAATRKAVMEYLSEAQGAFTTASTQVKANSSAQEALYRKIFTTSKAPMVRMQGTALKGMIATEIGALIDASGGICKQVVNRYPKDDK